MLSREFYCVGFDLTIIRGGLDEDVFRRERVNCHRGRQVDPVFET